VWHRSLLRLFDNVFSRGMLLRLDAERFYRFLLLLYRVSSFVSVSDKFPVLVFLRDLAKGYLDKYSSLFMHLRSEIYSKVFHLYSRALSELKLLKS